MPRIKHHNYAVEYDTGDGQVAEFDVRVLTADVLDAEAHGPTYGITDPHRQSIAINTMWIWAAARRSGNIPKNTGWPEFRERCIDWQALASVEVPPTLPGASDDSASSSAPASPEASTYTAGAQQPEMTNVSSPPL